MPPRVEGSDWEFPRFVESQKMSDLGYYPDRGRERDPKKGADDFWSVKFYPYNKPDVDPVFAVIGPDRILICRPPAPGGKTEVIRVLIDDEPDAQNFACAWTKNLETGTPLLCVAGNNQKIRIFNIATGKCEKTLIGHGGGINDLAISPTNPYILASASVDNTIRVWSLDPVHAAQPCAAILEGEGHKDHVHSVAFHSNGRYLLSSASDHLINLWVLPEFPDANTGTRKATRLYYPHFQTSEIHGSIVDCVAWYGDLILSKTACIDQTIVLWSINGFDSSLPPPTLEEAPTRQDMKASDTRSAFHKTLPGSTSASEMLYKRHLQLSIPEPSIKDGPVIFMRFSLFPGTPAHPNPVLAYCDSRSKISFFDFARLVKYAEDIDTFPPPIPNDESVANDAIASFTSNSEKSKTESPAPMAMRHPFLRPIRKRGKKGIPATALLHRRRDASPAESSTSHGTNSTGLPNPSDADATQKGAEIDWDGSHARWKSMYYMGDSLVDLKAHHEEVIPGLAFCGRQMGWSPGGEWCVVVGSGGVFAVLGRWR